MSKGVVAFAFGVPSTILSNQNIAWIAWRKARELGALVFTQRDVDVNANFQICSVDVDHVREESDNPPPTLRIAREAVRWAKQRGVTELYVVAAEPHLRRCVRDLMEADRELNGVYTLPIIFCGEISRVSDNDWFCSESTQERTRSRKAWNRRERILRMMPFWLYKRVAS